MRAGLRLGMAILAGWMVAPAAALAQNAAQASTNTPAAETIGPKELQGFSLNGTVTRQAETPPSATTRGQAQPPRTTVGRTATVAPRDISSAPAQRQTPAQRPTPAPDPPPASAGRSLALDLAPAAASPVAASAPEPGFAAEPAAGPATLAPEQRLELWPWLLLAGVLGAGAALLLWRRRSREAVADGPSVDAFVAPEPAPPPRPAPPLPAQPRTAAPQPVGIVSTRLRPWIDIAFVPLACAVEEDRVTVEFEVQLQNSGSAPARDILVEASLFNAGPTQEQDIGAFFANPVGQGERIQALPPLQNVSIRTALLAPRANIQLFELGGRQVFVPLVAFNAIYRLSSGTGQTSIAYLLGRETKGDKLGPLRVDLGPRAFTKLGIRPLPTGVRK